MFIPTPTVPVKRNDGFLDLDSLLGDILPSGSGIDANWKFRVTSRGKIIASNCYTCYTESGMVDGYVDFEVKIFINQFCSFEIESVTIPRTGNNDYLARKHDLLSYLKDGIFFDAENLQAQMMMSADGKVLTRAL